MRFYLLNDSRRKSFGLRTVHDMDHPCRRAATLVEILVVLGVLAVLLAIMSPMLASSRSAAQTLKSQSHLRQCGLSFFSYASEHGGQLPVIEPPRSPSGQPTLTQVRVRDITMYFQHFAQVSIWPIAMINYGVESEEIWQSPSDPVDQPFDFPRRVESGYLFSAAFMATPEHWRRGGAQSPHMWKAMRDFDVAHPSRKALLSERFSIARLRSPSAQFERIFVPVLFSDGALGQRLYADATSPVANTFVNHAAIPLVTTENGVLGVDYE